MKIIRLLSGLLVVAGLAYLLLAPVPITPVAWQSPDNFGYTGRFESNHQLADLQSIDISPFSGPEDIVANSAGELFVSVHQGKILKVFAKENRYEVFSETLGRPLGLSFNPEGDLIVADAYLGLLKLDVNGKATVLLNSAGGVALEYMNNVDVGDNGIIYFSDASNKFGAKANGGSYPASLLDLMEHCACGRVFAFDPDNSILIPLAEGLHFANGITLSADQKTLYISETSMYRVMKIDLQNKLFPVEPHIENLPGFPDNLTRGLDGKYWLGLVSPRNKMLDAVSDMPFIRRIIQRLPQAIRPKATFYSHVIAFDDAGNIVSNMQDPSGAYPTNTGVFETSDTLYISSLTAKVLAFKSHSKKLPK